MIQKLEGSKCSKAKLLSQFLIQEYAHVYSVNASMSQSKPCATLY